jgi:hypothetical protein
VRRSTGAADDGEREREREERHETKKSIREETYQSRVMRSHSRGLQNRHPSASRHSACIHHAYYRLTTEKTEKRTTYEDEDEEDEEGGREGGKPTA